MRTTTLKLVGPAWLAVLLSNVFLVAWNWPGGSLAGLAEVNVLVPVLSVLFLWNLKRSIPRIGATCKVGDAHLTASPWPWPVDDGTLEFRLYCVSDWRVGVTIEKVVILDGGLGVKGVDCNGFQAGGVEPLRWCLLKKESVPQADQTAIRVRRASNANIAVGARVTIVVSYSFDGSTHSPVGGGGSKEFVYLCGENGLCLEHSAVHLTQLLNALRERELPPFR